MISYLLLAATTLPAFGMVGTTCEEWTAQKNDSVYGLVHSAYVAGVLTGLNLGSRSNQTGEYDTQYLIGEINRLCLRKPNHQKQVIDIISVVTYVMMMKAHAKGVTPNWPPK